MKKLIKSNYIVKLLFCLIVFSALIFINFFPYSKQIKAGAYDQYVWQYYSPQNISGADDLKAKLTTEVQKIIRAGHLAPFRTLYGENVVRYDWINRYDSIYTLSLAYPYVDAATQTQIQTYIQSELSNYSPLIDSYGCRFLHPVNLQNSCPGTLTPGAHREADSLPANVYSDDTISEYYDQSRPDLFTLYALWLYAHNTNDWTFVNSNWNAIKTFYTTYEAELTGSKQFYTSIAGGIGMARLAQEKPSPDITARDLAVTDVNTAMAAGKNFYTFAKNAQNAYLFNKGNIPALPPATDTTEEGKQQSDAILGFQFLDITPEIGKYFSDDPTLKSLVLGQQGDPSWYYSLEGGEAKYGADWFMAKPGWLDFGYYGEGNALPPTFRAMLFPLHAWVKKDSTATLRGYLDVPYALVGDYYYIQNLSRTIQASGIECWEDLTTPTQECTSAITPPPSATTTPTATPIATTSPQASSPVASTTLTPTPPPSNANTPSPANPSVYPIGDLNGSGRVDIYDLSILLRNWGRAIDSDDLNGDKVVNIYDLSILLRNWSI